MFLLLGCSLLAGALASAQDSTSSSASGVQDQNIQTKSQSSNTKTNLIRGCLSGSTGNYTITDPNGMQYQINGDDTTLRSMVGREVEVSTTEDRSTEDSTRSGGAATHAANEVQVSDVKAVSNTCKNAPSAVAPNSTTPQAGERPAPQMMSMLQQQSAPGQDGQSQNGAAPQVQSTPPVTSQTPATSASPTTNNQSINNPAPASPSAAPASPNLATPSANPQPSQADCQNHTKPLYECPATDLPWGNSSSGNNSQSSH
jgi:hypothetical protein